MTRPGTFGSPNPGSSVPEADALTTRSTRRSMGVDYALQNALLRLRSRPHEIECKGCIVGGSRAFIYLFLHAVHVVHLATRTSALFFLNQCRVFL